MTHSPRVSPAGKSLVGCTQTTWAKGRDCLMVKIGGFFVSGLNLQPDTRTLRTVSNLFLFFFFMSLQVPGYCLDRLSEILIFLP